MHGRTYMTVAFENGVISYSSKALISTERNLWPFENGVISYSSKAFTLTEPHYSSFENGVISYSSKASNFENLT